MRGRAGRGLRKGTVAPAVECVLGSDCCALESPPTEWKAAMEIFGLVNEELPVTRLPFNAAGVWRRWFFAFARCCAKHRKTHPPEVRASRLTYSASLEERVTHFCVLENTIQGRTHPHTSQLHPKLLFYLRH
ncbi:unnamed protein product [Laminaria digitata]